MSKNEMKRILETVENVDLNEDETDSRELEDIKEEIKELIRNAERIVSSSSNRMAYERAKSYWIPHIITALDKEHTYLGSSMTTMQDTIDELRDPGYDR